MKTKVEIIKEVMSIYINDPSQRAVNEKGKCEYLTEDGRMCAVGQCMKEGEWQKSKGSVWILSYNYPLDSILKNEYQGHSIEFWTDLQRFHDDSKSWSKEGLTKIGQIKYNELLEKYKD